jgi:hypothetical protein
MISARLRHALSPLVREMVTSYAANCVGGTKPVRSSLVQHTAFFRQLYKALGSCRQGRYHV